MFLLRSLNFTIPTDKNICCNFLLLLQVSEVKTEFQHVRDDVEKFAEQCFKHACRMGEAVQIEPSSPRVTSRQCHRANNPASSPLDYYRRNLVIPVLDEVISEFDARFSKLSASAGQLVGLVPSVICQREVNVEKAAELYTSDLPSPELLDQEADRWKRKFLAIEPESRPTSCASAIKAYDPRTFPNLFVLLKIACTLPVTSCECEHSCSVFRRLSNYMRASMGQESLSSLALLHIHYDSVSDIDVTKVVDSFAALHPRRVEMTNMIYS